MANGLPLTRTASRDRTRVLRTMPSGARSLVLFLLMNTMVPVVLCALPSAEHMAKFIAFQGYFDYFGWAIIVFICLFGCITNIINIRIYNKMGLNESVNIVFCSLSWTDLICCFFSMIYHAFQHPWIKTLAMEYLSLELWEVPGSLIYIVCATSLMNSALVTAYMALQRCLCVAMPMKVKNIFTVRRTKIFMVSIASYCVLVGLPFLFILKFDWIHVNDTVNGTVVVNQRKYFGRINFESVYRQPVRDFVNYNQIAVKCVVMVILVVCTAILWKNLVSKSKWRNEATDSDTAASASKKEIRIIKTVVFICTLYIISSLPNSIFLAIFLSDPGFRGTRWSVYHWYLYRFLYIVTGFGNAGNVTANIFIYYSVSSQYRDVFNQMFSFHRRTIIGKDDATK